MIAIRIVPPAAVWPLRHRVMYPEMTFESIRLPEDAAGTHLGLFDDERLVSVVSLFRAGDALQFRKFATETAQQGKGYGALLLEEVLRHARQQGCTRVWCNARRSAAAFYQKFGFEATDHTFFKDGHDFVVMERMP